MSRKRIDFPPKTCPICGKSFKRTIELADKWRKKKTCSKKCRFVLIGRNRIPNAPKGKNHYKWKGGRTISYDGYIMVYCPNHPYGYRNHVLEHRLVMEDYLNKYLPPNILVHHINGIKTDNRLENLKCFTRAEHARLHSVAKEKWSMYGDNCKDCGTSSKKHNGHGLCKTCYMRHFNRKTLDNFI